MVISNESAHSITSHDFTSYLYIKCTKQTVESKELVWQLSYKWDYVGSAMTPGYNHSQYFSGSLIKLAVHHQNCTKIKLFFDEFVLQGLQNIFWAENCLKKIIITIVAA